MIANQKLTQKFLLSSSARICIPLLGLLAAFTLSSCTATSNGSSALQLAATADSSLVADVLQSAADEKTTEETTIAAAEPAKAETTAITPETKAQTASNTVAEPAPAVAVAEVKPTQKTSLVAALFPTPKSSEAFTAIKPAAEAKPETKPETKPEPVTVATTLSKPALELNKKTSSQSYNYSLPGVRAYGGLEIKHRSAVFDDSDIDADEDDAPYLLRVSAPGLARLAPNGLRIQRESVDVACLKPELVKRLRKLESHFKKPVIVTSGYRSPSYNVKVKGARKSLHMSCAAADIQIEGVSKWELARVARAMPARGGVGTYCHTKSVHIDTGPERDWNWKCRAKK